MSKMTILEVLKKIKHVDRKIEKLKLRLEEWCSYYDIKLDPGQQPLYDAKKLLQALNDLITLKSVYRHALHKANIEHKVEYKGKKLTIDELIMMRTVTLPAKKQCLELLRRKEKGYVDLRHLSEEERKEVKVITHPFKAASLFDSIRRDRSIDEIDDEMANLDLLLDDTNIVLKTDIDR